MPLRTSWSLGPCEDWALEEIAIFRKIGTWQPVLSSEDAKEFVETLLRLSTGRMKEMLNLKV